MRYVKLSARVFALSISRSMIYVQDFIVWTIVDLLWSVINIAFFKVLFLSIPIISGWSFEQLVIPLGILSLLNAFVWGAMYGNMTAIPQDINKGNLDVYLTKPVSSQFLLSTRYVSLHLLPTVTAGLLLLWYGFSVNHIRSLGPMVLVVVALVAAIVITYSVWFMTVTTAFWFNRLLNVAEIMPHSLDIARFPVTIFPPIVRFVFTFIFPLALLAFVPAEVILGRISAWYILLPVSSAGLMLFLSHKFWNFSLRRYQSASS